MPMSPDSLQRRDRMMINPIYTRMYSPIYSEPAAVSNSGFLEPQVSGLRFLACANDMPIGAISQLMDRSGWGNHSNEQATSGKRATNTANQLNGKPTLRFDNGDTYLISKQALFDVANGANTMFIVGKRTSEAGAVDTMISATEAGGQRYNAKFSATAGAINFISRTGDASLVTSTGNTNTKYNIMRFRRSGTTQAIAVAGGTETTNSSGADESGVDSIYIGSRLDIDGYWDGNLAEIRIYNKSLSTAEILEVEVFLADKWAVYHPSATWIQQLPLYVQYYVHLNKWNYDEIAAGLLTQTQALVAAGVAASPLVLTRATTKTYYDNAGIIQTAAIDTAALNYLQDGSGLSGLSLEGERTNLLKNSRLTSNWSSNGSASKTDNALTSPDGTANAGQVTTAAGANSGYNYGSAQGLAVTTGVTYTASVFLKYISGTLTVLRFRFESGFTTALVDFNTSTGLITNTGAGIISSEITTLPNGWFRLAITATATSTTNAVVSVYDQDAANSGVFGVWGAQVEVGNFASSYIPTTTVPVTRSADLLSAPLLSANGFSSTQGTFLIDAISANQAQTGDKATVVEINNDTVNNRIQLARDTTKARGYATILGSDVAAIDAGTWSNQTRNKVAMAYAADNYGVSNAGAAAVTDTSGDIPSALVTLDVGSNALGTGNFFGHLITLTYYPARLPDATLVTLTT